MLGLPLATDGDSCVAEGKRQHRDVNYTFDSNDNGAVVCEEGNETEGEDIGDEEMEELMSDVTPIAPLNKPKTWEELRKKIDDILLDQKKKNIVSMLLTQVSFEIMTAWAHQ